MTTTEEIPNIEWVVDLEVEPPQRLIKLTLDSPTIISLIDIADAASFAGGQHTRDNAAIVREYFLRVNRELERRSLIDHSQWAATKHLDGDE